jgi:hypothetical protein
MVNRKGQSTLEYALIIAAVVAGLFVMQHYVKRGYQGKLKSASDDMGQQFDPASYKGNITQTQSATVHQVVKDQTTTSTQMANQVSNRTGEEHQGGWRQGTNVYGEGNETE